MKVLSPRGHGYIDYLVVLAFCAAPSVLEFEGTPETAAYALAGVHLLLTILTDFPLGLAKLVPFPLHGILEFLVAILLVALPWVLGFHGIEAAKMFYIGAGASVLLVFLITDYRR